MQGMLCALHFKFLLFIDGVCYINFMSIVY